MQDFSVWSEGACSRFRSSTLRSAAACCRPGVFSIPPPFSNGIEALRKLRRASAAVGHRENPS
jgi:hypothetical protein